MTPIAAALIGFASLASGRAHARKRRRARAEALPRRYAFLRRLDVVLAEPPT